ncbi:MAG: metal ABC transporter ATP-binding protein, partial [Actinomycetota bacterium]|nr:metal ABC transporter ATP-binding protein [Actinomycetota bacterium]
VTGLDIGSRDLIIAAIDAEREAGHTIVFTTHDLADAGRADHVLLMASKVYAEGSPDEVLDPDLLSAAYGVGILHLEDGSLALDDGHHAAERHVHFERRL